MSGVTGNQKIKSRKDFREILKEYKKIIEGFPGFKSLDTSGSYNSDKSKKSFGDIDLIVHIDGHLYEDDKKKIKASLSKYLTSYPDSIIMPFASEKYYGKRYYNSGEIITVSFKHSSPNINACQIDNIIAMDSTEAKFKKDFLDMPAEKQGLVLGLIKTALVEQRPSSVFKRLGIKENPKELLPNQEYEFNLSSKEIQLRKVTYDKPGSYKQISREIVWTSRDWGVLQKILKDFDLSLSFEKLIKQAKDKLKKTRSTKRMAGVFKSMISIKSGEVGTEKAAKKQKALDKVQRIFGESTSLKFKDYIEEIALETGFNDNEINPITSKPTGLKYMYDEEDKNINRIMFLEDIVEENKNEFHGIYPGRFQPLTKAHTMIIEKMAKENSKATVFLVKGKKTSQDKNKNPFDEKIQLKMLKKVLPSNVEVKILPTGFFVDELNEMEDKEFKVYADNERTAQYNRFKSYLDEDKTMEIILIHRTDEDISATKVRNALKNNDKKTFEKMTDKRIHSMYEELRKIITSF